MNSTNNEQKNSYRFILISVIFVTILVIIVIALSFIAFKKVESSINDGDKYSEGEGGGSTSTSISMTYTENTNGISIQNALPTSDEIGKALSGTGEYFDFTVSSKLSSGAAVTYEIAAIKDEESTISDDQVKLYLEKQVSGSYEQVMEPTLFKPISKDSEVGSPEGSMILYQLKKKKSESDNYRLRMWIKEDANVEMDQVYTVKVNVYGKAF